MVRKLRLTGPGSENQHCIIRREWKKKSGAAKTPDAIMPKDQRQFPVSATKPL
jgi:hypothetical protein